MIGLAATDLTLPGILLAGLGIMATVVGVLWKIITARNTKTEAKADAADIDRENRLKRLEERSDECDRDRRELANQIAELAKRIPM